MKLISIAFLLLFSLNLFAVDGYVTVTNGSVVIGSGSGGGGTVSPTTLTQTNFVLNTVYTNGTQSALLKAVAALTTAAVNGDASLDLYADQLGGNTFILLSRNGIGTTVAVTLSMTYTNSMDAVIAANATYYWTNSSTGSGNSSAIISGTGQIATIASGTNGAAGASNIGTIVPGMNLAINTNGNLYTLSQFPVDLKKTMFLISGDSFEATGNNWVTLFTNTAPWNSVPTLTNYAVSGTGIEWSKQGFDAVSNAVATYTAGGTNFIFFIPNSVNDYRQAGTNSDTFDQWTNTFTAMIANAHSVPGPGKVLVVSRSSTLVGTDYFMNQYLRRKMRQDDFVMRNTNLDYVADVFAVLPNPYDTNTFNTDTVHPLYPAGCGIFASAVDSALRKGTRSIYLTQPQLLFWYQFLGDRYVWTFPEYVGGNVTSNYFTSGMTLDLNANLTVGNDIGGNGTLTVGGITNTGVKNATVLGSDANGKIIVGSAGSGTVTSVAISGPSDITWANSPVTTSGTLTATRANQSANTVLAGPTSGSAATPAYRVIDANDLPLLPGANITLTTNSGKVTIASSGGGGGGSPGGNNTEIQINNSGSFGSITNPTIGFNQSLVYTGGRVQFKPFGLSRFIHDEFCHRVTANTTYADGAWLSYSANAVQIINSLGSPALGVWKFCPTNTDNALYYSPDNGGIASSDFGLSPASQVDFYLLCRYLVPNTNSTWGIFGFSITSTLSSTSGGCGVLYTNGFLQGYSSAAGTSSFTGSVAVTTNTWRTLLWYYQGTTTNSFCYEGAAATNLTVFATNSTHMPTANQGALGLFFNGGGSGAGSDASGIQVDLLDVWVDDHGL